MQIHNTETSYGLVAKSLHWIVGLLIIMVWIVGMYMTGLTEADSERSMLYNLHKSVGMVILMLVVIRLTWRLYDGNPGYGMMNRIMVTAAKTVHYLLYVAMFVQPLSGWAMSSAAGYNPTFFDLFTFPAIAPKDPHLSNVFFAIHNATAWVFLELLVMHVGAALMHHFVLKDNTLRRMTVD